VRDRPRLKPMIPRRLLKSMSMAHGALNIPTLADSHPGDSETQRNDTADVEMGSNLGDELDYDAGSCPSDCITVA
jgi:hypothetical protein